MITLENDSDPVAQRVEVTATQLIVHLDDGRSVRAPLAHFPRLLHATSAERANWRFLGGGYAVEWPELDEHIGIEGLLAGRGSGENPESLARWLRARQAAA
jgi:hypothetical protein